MRHPLRLLFAMLMVSPPQLVPAAASTAGAPAPAKILPLPGAAFEVSGRPAFLLPAKTTATDIAKKSKPWVWYAPTLGKYPGKEERWMFEQFLAAGIAIAGIDAGESYGSPAGVKIFSALHAELTTARGYSTKPVLLGRSRGGLQLLSWAEENPTRVAAFTGIYPVFNLASYPGLAQAAPAFALTTEQLTARLAEFNPIDRLAPLAAARLPLFAIHGDADKLVPLEANSALLQQRYTALGGAMALIVPPGQGHPSPPRFFQNLFQSRTGGELRSPTPPQRQNTSCCIAPPSSALCVSHYPGLFVSYHRFAPPTV